MKKLILATAFTFPIWGTSLFVWLNGKLSIFDNKATFPALIICAIFALLPILTDSTLAKGDKTLFTVAYCIYSPIAFILVLLFNGSA